MTARPPWRGHPRVGPGSCGQSARLARALSPTGATVKGYVSNALDKAGCSNRTQLGLLAREAGLSA